MSFLYQTLIVRSPTTPDLPLQKQFYEKPLILVAKNF